MFLLKSFLLICLSCFLFICNSYCSESITNSKEFKKKKSLLNKDHSVKKNKIKFQNMDSERRERLKKRFDSNGDANLDKDERVQMRKELLKNKKDIK